MLKVSGTHSRIANEQTGQRGQPGMKRLSFNTFVIDETNRQAADICRRIANLQPVAPLPVTLVGDHAAGKTHLLYAIVNRVRAASSNTGLAYVTAQVFPDQVRALIDDPSPVERAPTAILLVDQLDRFTGLVEELEAIVRIFLENDHYVVLASAMHPGRLVKIPEGLRRTILAGQVVDMAPHTEDATLELVRQEAREEAQEEIEGLRQEIDLLKVALAEKNAIEPQPSGTAIEETRAASAENERLEGEIASLRQRIESQETAQEQAADEIESLREQLTDKQAQLDEAADEAQRLQSALLVAQENAVEPHDLVERLNTLTAEREALQESFEAECKRAEEQLEAKTALEHDHERLTQELASARTEAEQARDRARSVEERASALLEHVEAYRRVFEGTSAEQLRLAEGIQAGGAAEIEIALQEAYADAQRLRTELEQVRSELEETHSAHNAALAERDSLLQENNETQKQAEERQNTIERLEAELRGLEERHVKTVQDLDAKETAYQQAQDELAGKDQLIASLEEEVEEKRGELLAKTELLDTLRTEVAQHEAQLVEKTGALEATQVELEQVRSDLASRNQELDALHTEIQGAQATIADRDGAVKAVRAELEEVRRTSNEKDSKLAVLHARLREVEETLQTKQRALDTLNQDAAAQIAEANAQAGELEKRVKRAAALLEKAQKVATGAESRLKTLIEQVASGMGEVAESLGEFFGQPDEEADTDFPDSYPLPARLPDQEEDTSDAEAAYQAAAEALNNAGPSATSEKRQDGSEPEASSADPSLSDPHNADGAGPSV